MRYTNIFLLLLVVSGSANAATLTLTPSTSTIGVGDSFVLDLSISGLGTGSAPSLGGFDLNLGYNSSFFQLSGTPTFGDPLSGDQLDLAGFGSIAISLDSGTAVNLFELSFDTVTDLTNLQVDTFVLAQLTFTAITPGTGSFFFDGGVALTNELGDPIPVTTLTGALVTVTDPNAAVPEPQTASLMAIAFAASLLLRRKSASVKERI